eukprot:11205568-Lingulodinium_polyedra.AAC.1
MAWIVAYKGKETDVVVGHVKERRPPSLVRAIWAPRHHHHCLQPKWCRRMHSSCNSRLSKTQPKYQFTPEHLE